MVTITLNPSLDVSTAVPAVTPEQKLRCEPARREPGGGGINVARVAKRLGATVDAVVVLGGSTGDTMRSLLEAEGIPIRPIMVDAETRQCLAVTERSTDRQYRFVLPGPPLDQTALDLVSAGLVSQLRPEQGHRAPPPLVVISGSFPSGTGGRAIHDLVAAVPDADVIVDTSGPALRHAVEAGVFLVKPSVRELASLVERELMTEADVTLAAEEVLAGSDLGAVLASIGAGGAVLASRGEDSVRLRAPSVRVRSAVGAGDSLVGGLAVALARGETLADAAVLGVAAGTAATLTEGSGLCTVAGVERLRPLVRPERSPLHRSVLGPLDSVEGGGDP